MYKRFFLIIIFLGGLIFSIFSQTWQEVDPTDNTVICEYTVITQQEFNRLLHLNEKRNEFALLEFEDVLEIRNGKVKSGIRPNLRGYYIICKMSSTNSEIQGVLALMGTTNYLIYGNSETGRMSIWFLNTFGALTLSTALQDVVKVDSDDYTNKYNQFISFVNGE